MNMYFVLSTFTSRPTYLVTSDKVLCTYSTRCESWNERPSFTLVQDVSTIIVFVYFALYVFRWDTGIQFWTEW